MSSHYKSIKEIADEWKVSPRRVQILCTHGRIPGAYKDGRIWRIPEGSEKPDDNRVKEGANEQFQYFSEMRKSSYNFLDAYSAEVRSDISSIINYCDLLKENPYDESAVLKFVAHMRNSAGRILDSTMELSNLMHLDREVSYSAPFVINLKRTADSFFSAIKMALAETDIVCECVSDFKTEYVIANIDLHYALLRSLLAILCRYSSQDGIIHVRITEMPSADSKTCTLRFSFSADKYSETMTKRQVYVRSAYLLALITKLGGRYGDQIEDIDSLITKSDFVFEIDYEIASEKDYDSNVERGWSNSFNEIDMEFFKDKKVIMAISGRDNRESEYESLTHAGINVEVVDSGIQLLSKIEQEPAGTYNLIVLDTNMPNFSGIAAIKAIRQFTDSKGSIPIIAIIDEFDRTRLSTIEAGANDFLFRPFQVKRFIMAAKNVLGN